MNKWQPWNLFNTKNPILSIDDISKPPCGECINFSPRAVTDEFGNYSGVRLCIAKKMYSDFSCFESYKDEG